MNLEKLNLVELVAQEAVVTEGGTWWIDWLINVGGPSVGVNINNSSDDIDTVRIRA